MSETGLWWAWDGQSLQPSETPQKEALTFEVDVSRTYRNKEGYEASGYKVNTSFVTESHTPGSFIETVIKEGWPYTMAHDKRSPEETGAAARGVTTPKHTENFRSAQLLTFDDDSREAGVVDWWLADPFFSKHGWLFVESVNSRPGKEKGHPTILLDRPIEDGAIYKECLQAFSYAYPRLDRLVNVDRTIYNAEGATVHELGNVCPFDVFEREILAPYRQAEREKLEAVEAERAKRQAAYEQAKAEGRTVPNDVKEACVAGYLTWVFEKVARASAGDNRNSRLYWAGRCIAGVEDTEWATPYKHLLSNVEGRIVRAADANGYLKDYAHGNDNEVLRIFRRGRQAGGEALEEPVPRPAFGGNGFGAEGDNTNANTRRPRFAAGDRVNVVISGVLQNGEPCEVVTVHPEHNGEYGYTVTWADGKPRVYQQSNLEPAGQEQDAGGFADMVPAVTLGEQLPTAAVSYLKDCFYREELGDGELFASLYPERLVYDHSEGDWYLWAGHYWQRDATQQVKLLFSGQVAAQYLTGAAELTKKASEAKAAQNEESAETLTTLAGHMMKRARGLRQVRRMKHALEYAASLRAVTGEMWDTQPLLLPVANGVVDL